VTDNEIKAEIALGPRTVEDIDVRGGAGTNCGMCHDKLEALCAASCPLVELRS